MFEFDIFIDGYKSLSRYAALKAADYPVRAVIHITRGPHALSSHQQSGAAGAQLSAPKDGRARIVELRESEIWMRERTIVVGHENLAPIPSLN